MEDLVALTKVLARGQITIPREVREKVHLGPGDLVRIETIGLNRFVVEVIPTLTLAEILVRFHSDEPVDMIRLREEGENDAAREVIAKMNQPANERE
jgi:AbrB family looped-hinge helix DNA binding protein